MLTSGKFKKLEKLTLLSEDENCILIIKLCDEFIWISQNEKSNALFSVKKHLYIQHFGTFEIKIIEIVKFKNRKKIRFSKMNIQ